MSSFYIDVIQKDPRYHTTAVVADLGLLEPGTRQAVLGILADANAQGLQLMVYETYRSQERQQVLFANGASQLKTVGVHHYGLACDIVRNVAGQPSWKGDFTFLRPLAKKHGLVWGGDWGTPALPHSFIDLDHVQRCRVADQNKLFAGTWYPDAAYDPNP